MSNTEELAKRLERLTPAQRQNIALLAMPRIVEPYIAHIPHPTQQVFLSLNNQLEVFFGGAGGGGKSDALLMAALQFVDVPGYAALILRKTWPDLVLPGAIMDRARQWLTDTPAVPHDGGRIWTFPSGARLQFGHLQHDNDKYKYRSAEFQFIAFDELTMWGLEGTYDYLFSRLRQPAVACLNCSRTLTRKRDPHTNNASYWHKKLNDRKRCTKGPFPDPKTMFQYQPAKDGTTIFDIPLRMRSASNPGGPGHDWVKTRFVDETTRREDVLFVPSLLRDNPSLDEDSYTESLDHLNPVDQARMKEGDWDATESGDMFERGNFHYIKEPPAGIRDWVRYWDMASSENTGDWTAGALCGITTDGDFVIADITRRQKRPHEVENYVSATARVDGINVAIRQEQEPGSSGVHVIDHFRRNVVPGYNYDGVRVTGSKEARASALAAYVRGKRVYVVLGQWNREFLNEIEQFPLGAHDDQVDAVSGAFNNVMFGPRARLIN